MTDPVLAKRARIARLVSLGLAAGYGLFALAVVLFIAGLVFGYAGWLTNTVVVALVVGSIVLAPSIVFNYAVRAAAKDDAERGLA